MRKTATVISRCFVAFVLLALASLLGTGASTSNPAAAAHGPGWAEVIR